MTELSELIERPATVDDAATLADLFNAVEVAAGGHPYTTESDQRSALSGWITEPERNSRVLITPDGVAVAFAGLVVPPSGATKADLPGGVLPEWRDQGIGRRLMAWQLERAATANAELAPDLRWEVSAGCLDGDKTGISLLNRFGFSVERYFMDMSAPAVATHRSEPPAPLTMRPFADGDDQAVYDTHVTAFRDHWGFQQREYDRWIGMTVRSESFRPDLTRLVFDGDQLVAYTLAYDNQPGELYVGQVGTLRAYRRRGLASTMLGEVLAAAHAAGLETVHLGVDADSPTGAVGVYERVGFTLRTRYTAFQRSVHDDALPVGDQ